MYPRALGVLVAGMLLVSLAVLQERRTRLGSVTTAGLESREDRIPNYHHLWFAHDLVFVDGKGSQLSVFGADALSKAGNWSELCRLDSDNDGLTNGEELGDPCCRWNATQHSSFSLLQQREYRRWALSHPGGPESVLSRQFGAERLVPLNCSTYDPALYAEQFRTFYFNRADGAYEPTRVVMVKVISLVFLLVLSGHWAWNMDLCADLAPWCSHRPHLTGRTSLAVMLLSFLYMDVTSGIVHLILDYAPHWLPVLGDLARGFQFHHHDPTAIVRISWYAYVSHVHLLCPVVGALLLCSEASRVQRLFWFWGAVFVHLFQTTHRWAHFKPEQLSWLVRLWQSSGLLLTHERHMHHHEDLESQFTILSGHTDVLLDAASSVVPPIRYDIWLFIGIVWFLLPVALDIRFRHAFEALELTKPKKASTDEQGIPLKDFDL